MRSSKINVNLERQVDLFSRCVRTIRRNAVRSSSYVELLDSTYWVAESILLCNPSRILSATYSSMAMLSMSETDASMNVFDNLHDLIYDLCRPSKKTCEKENILCCNLGFMISTKPQLVSSVAIESMRAEIVKLNKTR